MEHQSTGVVSSTGEGAAPPGSEFGPKGRTRSVRTAIMLILAAAGFLMSMHLGIQYALRSMLIQHAHSNGMEWAHQIEARTPNLPAISRNWHENPAEQRSEASEFLNMINGMLAVGHIYQIDVINPDCHCEISLGTYASTKRGETIALGDTVLDHNHGEKTPFGTTHRNSAGNIAALPPIDQMRHVFENETPHPPMPPGAADGYYPLDGGLVRRIAKTAAHDIMLRDGDGVSQPAAFAEVFHPVTANGELSYILRVLVDLEEDRARYAMALYAGAAVVVILLMIAFGYPTAQFLRSSRQQRESARRAHFLATHDVLTNTNNRHAFQEGAPKILRECRASGKTALICVFDLDRFKEINDYHSHRAGDLLLCAFADMLKRAAPPGSIVARLGGDEFVVIVGGLDDPDTSFSDVLRLSSLVQVAQDENRMGYETTISAGIVRYPRDGGNLEELMRNADLALRAAKASGDATMREYDAQMGIDFFDRLDLRDEFRKALEKSQIEPFYQPLVNMITGRVEGLEALARWNHPKRGILTPVAFSEMLDDRELGAMVGVQMIRKIVQDMKRWKQAGVPFETVGINIGEGDLLQSGFALNVVAELAQHGLRGKNLAIEVTETCMFGGNKHNFISQLKNLRRAGCSIALDDFGTGFSSITQIKELPCTSVKIDKSFVNEVVHDTADQSIIKSLLELGRSMSFKLVLEGVETPEQLNLLRSLGCEIAQGFHYSRPVPARDVPALIDRLNAAADQREPAQIAVAS